MSSSIKKNLGELYDETSNFQQAQFDYFVQLIEDNVAIDQISSMLEIGARTGKCARKALDIFPGLQQITALEPDPDMYEQAVKKHSDPRIQYLKKSAFHIGQMDGRYGYYDAILSHWGMHWLADKETVFESLERVVDEGSYIFISSCERLPQILLDIDAYIRSELSISPETTTSPFHYLTRPEWEDLLERHGWEIVKGENFQVAHAVASAKSYLEHWFTASTAKFTYNRHLVEINKLALSDLAMFMERKYGAPDEDDGLVFKEDIQFLIARKVR